MKRIFGVLLTVCLVLGLTACGAKEERWQEQYDLGIRYLSEGNYEEAILAFDAAIEIDPNNPITYLDRAQAFLEVGDQQSALLDVETALQKSEEPTVLGEKLAALSEQIEDPEAFRQLLEQYLQADEVDQIAGTAHDVRLKEKLSEYQMQSVSTDSFISCVGYQQQEYPDRASGFISGYLRDVDCDGERELVSAWSEDGRIYLKLTQVADDGSLQEENSEAVTELTYSGNVKVALYHRPNTDQWLVAVLEYTYASYSGYYGYTCKLFQFCPEGLVFQNILAEEENPTSDKPLYFSDQNHLKIVQWPLDAENLLDVETGELDDLTYLAQVDSHIDLGEEIRMTGDDTYSLGFLSAEKLAAQSQPDKKILGTHARPNISMKEMIGKTVDEVVSAYGVAFETGGDEGIDGIWYRSLGVNFCYDYMTLEVRLLTYSGTEEIDKGVRIGMTYPEMVAAAGEGVVIPEPTGGYEEMYSTYEYSTSYQLGDYRYEFIWWEDPYTTGSGLIYVFRNDADDSNDSYDDIEDQQESDEEDDLAEREEKKRKADAINQQTTWPLKNREAMSMNFSSGAGGWSTKLTLEADGSFHGHYYDFDLGDTGIIHPNGIAYINDFSGRFRIGEKRPDGGYALTLEELHDDTAEDCWWKYGCMYVHSDPYGLEKGKEFVLYPPNTSTENLDQEFVMWLYNPGDPLGCWGLRNVETSYGFFCTGY